MYTTVSMHMVCMGTVPKEDMMQDVSVVYQAHRAGHPDMASQMWVTSWHHYMDNHGVSRSNSFATEEEAVEAALELIRAYDGYSIVREDGVREYVVPEVVFEPWTDPIPF